MAEPLGGGSLEGPSCGLAGLDPMTWEGLGSYPAASVGPGPQQWAIWLPSDRNTSSQQVNQYHRWREGLTSSPRPCALWTRGLILGEQVI